MNCPNCRAPVSAGRAACHRCGHALGPAESDAAASLGGIRNALLDHSKQLTQSVGRARGAAAAAKRLIAAERAEAEGAADRRDAEERNRAETDATGEADERLARARRLASQLAPGPAGADWDSPLWATNPDDGAPVAYARMGGLALPGQDAVPVALPVGDGGHLVVRARVEQRDAAIGMLQAALLRIVASAPLGRVQFRIFDPTGTGTSFSAFGEFPHGDVAETMPLTSMRELDDAVTDLIRHSTMVATTYLRGIHDSLTEFHNEVGFGTSPYRVLVLTDYPRGIRGELFDRLRQLAAAGAAAGVYLLVHENPDVPLEFDAGDRELGGPVTTIEHVRDNQWRASTMPNATFTPDARLPTPVVHAVAGRGLAPPPAVTFDRVIASAPRYGESSASGLRTVIGAAGLRDAAVALGDQPVHAIIGGGSGMGKSNLLKVLIYGLAHRYDPSELEMYLLDYKQGVEFREFAQTGRVWLPHARFVSVNSDRALGVAVLEHLARMTAERYTDLNDRGFLKLEERRAADPDLPWPRLLLVIDEFHVLFQRADDLAARAVAALDDLARQGRAAGVHVILASQTVSDVGRGQGIASRFEGIFGQFGLRISLHTTPQESQAILQPGNKAGADLRARGVAIVNSMMGAPQGNERVVVARLEPKEAGVLRADLLRDARGLRRPPRIFDGRKPADVTENHQLSAAVQRPERTTGALRTWIGTPLVLDTADPAATVQQTAQFARDPNRHLAVLGSGVKEATAILQWAALGLGAQSSPDSTDFVLLDLLRPDDGVPEDVVGATAGALERLGHRGVSVVGVGDVAARLPSLEADLAEADPQRTRFIVAFGLDRAPGLKNELSQADGRFTVRTPLASFQRLIADGPVSGHHVLGWWTSIDTFTDHVGRAVPSVGMLAFLGVAQKDIRAVIPVAPDWEPRPLRGLWFDRDQSGSPTPFVPYDACGAEALAAILEQPKVPA